MDKIHKDIIELIGTIESSPAYSSPDSIQKEPNLTQEELAQHSSTVCMDYLKICIKYILLDLEATKREIQYLINQDRGNDNE